MIGFRIRTPRSRDAGGGGEDGDYGLNRALAEVSEVEMGRKMTESTDLNHATLRLIGSNRVDN